jgi:predicted methyltransferase
MNSSTLRHIALRHIALRRVAPAAIAALALAALICVPGPVAAQDFNALLAAPDRVETDRVIDKRRDPLQLLQFTGVRSGMTVLDMGAGGGYSTELMARAAGPTGKVYAQNAPDMNENGRKRFAARMETPAMKDVVLLTRKYDDPVPAELRDLDLITFFFAYHDVSYMEVDRAAMNRKLFEALKPGGSLVISDHSAKAGDGVSVGKSLHRIEEAALRREVEAAGFKLVATGDFLRQPSDPRDFTTTKPTGPVDEFVLRFEKPK